MIREFIKDEAGQDIVEYSLLLVLIAVAALTVLTTLGTSVRDLFSKISNRLSTTASSVS